MLSKDFIKLLVAVALLILINSLFFQVREDRFAVSKLFGKIDEQVYEAGLHFKYPFIEQIYIYDKRIQSLEKPGERFLTMEKKNLIVDYDIRWRIASLRDFYTNVSGDVDTANNRISAIINDILKSVISRRTVRETITGERDDLTRSILEEVSNKAKNLGILVLDIRLKKVDFPPEVNSSVFNRMIKERATVAKEFRSEGREQSIEIRAKADREREEILANAYKNAQIARGEGDGKANRLYSNAYGKNIKFFQLYRTLEAYRSSFTSGNDILILDSDSEFLKYLKKLK